jgi:transposase
MGNLRGVKRDFKALEERRFRAWDLLQKGFNQSEVARRIRVCSQTVSRWAGQVAASGQQALRKAGRAGRKPGLEEQQKHQLEKLLLKGPERLGYDTPLWTSRRVARLIEKEFGVRYHQGHVWKILRGLGWSCQRPESRARERNEVAIRQWKKVQWPAIKKKPGRKVAPSFSWTKAGSARGPIGSAPGRGAAKHPS